MNQNNLLCQDCRHARKSGAKVVKCLSIGSIELTALYGRCRRYLPRKLLRAPELCPTCINFLPLPDWDGCLVDIADTDVITDMNGVICTCRHYCKNPQKSLFDE